MKSNNSKTSKNSIMDTYSTIYFVDIVVANKNVTLEELKELYIYPDGVELDGDLLDGDATTSTVIRKSDNKACVLVKYNHPCKIVGLNKSADFINTISHEATHIALDIYEYIHQNVCFCSQEPFCYLQGYAAECIYKTLTKK